MVETKEKIKTKKKMQKTYIIHPEKPPREKYSKKEKPKEKLYEKSKDKKTVIKSQKSGHTKIDIFNVNTEIDINCIIRFI